MKNILSIILGLCLLFYSINMIYNAIAHNNSINPVSTVILIGAIIYIIYILIKDARKKTKEK